MILKMRNSNDVRRTAVRHHALVARDNRGGEVLRFQDVVFEAAYADARALAIAETGLPERRFPVGPAYTLEQTLDPDSCRIEAAWFVGSRDRVRTSIR
jgi:hypothetical protein